jgi:hypothetical protein
MIDRRPVTIARVDGSKIADLSAGRNGMYRCLYDADKRKPGSSPGLFSTRSTH